MLKPVVASVLSRYFTIAQGQAKEYIDRNHSADQTGAAHEDVPQWARQFFRLFETVQNAQSVSIHAVKNRSKGEVLLRV